MALLRPNWEPRNDIGVNLSTQLADVAFPVPAPALCFTTLAMARALRF
jgi:hypothetical protein